MPAPQTAMAFLAALALAPHLGRAQAPPVDPEPDRRASATLPESNEALLLGNRVEQALDAADYRLAIELLEQMIRLRGGLVAAPASRTFQPPWRQAARLETQFPSEAVQMYRQLYDAEVQARFERAAQAADLETLRTLFRERRLSSTWPTIGIELAARLMDAGVYGEAVEVLQDLARSLPQSDPALTAQRVVALTLAGAWRSADRLLTELESPQRAPPPQLAARLADLRDWYTVRRAAAHRPAEGAGAFHPLIAPEPAWALPLNEAAESHVGYGDDVRLADAIDTYRRLPLVEPLVVGDTLLVRQRGVIRAIDALTLTLRWQVDEILPEAVEPSQTWDAPAGAGIPPELSGHLRHTMAAAFGKLFTIEGVPAEREGLGRHALEVLDAGAGRNVLVARELQSGRVVWRSSADPSGPLFDVAFQDRPVIVGEAIAAPIVRGEELHLAVIDPASGGLLREVDVVGPPTDFPQGGGRCLLTVDETTVYVCTGHGVVAALDRRDLSWKWATVYPSTLAERLTRLWWQQPQVPTTEFGSDRPLLAGDLLIVAAADSSDLFALDRFTGRERWRMPRGEFAYLVGATEAGVVAGGAAVCCLDPDDPDGRPLRWRSLPLEISGRPTLREERLYVPTRNGLVVLDGRTGKVLFDQSLAGAANLDAAAPADDDARRRAVWDRLSAGRQADSLCHNLVACDWGLFAVSGNAIAKYPDPAATESYCETLRLHEVDQPRAALAMAWVEALEGAYESALSGLEPLTDLPPPLAQSRRRLLTQTYLALARSAAKIKERLGWLNRAAGLADSSDAGARLAMLIGQTLEEAGRWDEALAHYTTLIVNPDGPAGASAVDAVTRAAVWLQAADRLAAVLANQPHRAGGVLARAASAAGDERSAVGLQRLYVALASLRQREELAPTLLRLKLAPELALQYVPRDLDARWPAPLRRELLLRRWDLHTALGMLDAAAVDREEWRQLWDQLSAGQAALSEAEKELLKTVERSAAKLEPARGVPFDESFTRQWFLPHTELLLDSRRPLDLVRPWILVRSRESNEIALIETFAYQEYAWRKHNYGLSQGAGARAAERVERERTILGRRTGVDGARREAWPAVAHDHLAAVPVLGGLVCVGLGPERGAGTRLWEFAVPEWSDVPREIADRAVAGPLGVYFCPRDDRVVLVGWFDGQLWWQRDFAGLRIEQLALAGDRLVVVGEERQVWLLDALRGREVGVPPIESLTPRDVNVTAGTLLVWGDELAAGFDVGSLERLWLRPLRAARGGVPVHGRPWIAYAERGGERWQMIDVRSGLEVIPGGIGELGDVTALAESGNALLVAGRVVAQPEGGGPDLVRLAAFSLPDGAHVTAAAGPRGLESAARWRLEVPTRVPVNLTQLVGHPQFIPLLLDRPQGDPAEAKAYPALQLVRKADGTLLARRPIGEDLRRSEAECDMYLLCTPTRIIVQAYETLLAYGCSGLRAER